MIRLNYKFNAIVGTIYLSLFYRRFVTDAPKDWSLYYRGDEKVRCPWQIEHAIFVRHRAHFCSRLRCNVIVVFSSITEMTFYIIIPVPYSIAITSRYNEWRWLSETLNWDNNTGSYCRIWNIYDAGAFWNLSFPVVSTTLTALIFNQGLELGYKNHEFHGFDVKYEHFKLLTLKFNLRTAWDIKLFFCQRNIFAEAIITK